MSGPTDDEGWDDGTAVAGPGYDEAIAKSDPDFEVEVGTAVADETYAESIRKSAHVIPAHAEPIARPGVAQRAPTMAFGTPVMLRGPATAPSPGSPVVGKATSLGIPAVGRATPAPLPGTPVVRAATPAPGTPVLSRAPAPVPGAPVVSRVVPTIPALSRTATTPLQGIPAIGRTETEREVVSAAARNARSNDARKPAPSPHVDQPFGTERTSGVIGVPDEPLRDCRSGPMAAPVETRDRRSGPLAKPAIQRPLDKPIIEKRRFEFDESEEVDSEEDEPETILQPLRRDSEPIAARPPTPSPLRPAPTPVRASTPSRQLDSQGYGTGPATPPAIDAYLPPSPGEVVMPDPVQPSSPLPSTYPMVSHEAMHAFRSPLSAPLAPTAAPAPAVAPKRRLAVIAACVFTVVALGIGAFMFLRGEDPAPTVAKAEPPGTKAAAATPATANKATPTETAAAAAETMPAEAPAETKPSETPAEVKTTTPAKASAKAVKKTAAAPKKAPVRKVTKKSVRKAPVRKAAPKKKKAAAAAKCSGLDCL